MKWFFTVTQQQLRQNQTRGAAGRSEDIAANIRAAVKSAQANTSLVPHMVYDGESSAFTHEMEALGVKIIFHRLSWLDRLEYAQLLRKPEWSSYMEKASGAFLCLALPEIEKDEKYVLYTGTNVLFLKDSDFSAFQPEVLAASGRFWQKKERMDLDSGVILFNLERLGQDVPDLIDFLCQKFDQILGFEQALFSHFYRDKTEFLPCSYSWKPYWGIASEAAIIHFSTTEPEFAYGLLKDPAYGQAQAENQFRRYWFFQNPEGYARYIPKWLSYRENPPEKVQNAVFDDDVAAFDAVRGESA